MNDYTNYLYYDRETEEEFIVAARTEKERDEILAEYEFNDADLIDTLTDYEAEVSGLDTY